MKCRCSCFCTGQRLRFRHTHDYRFVKLLAYKHRLLARSPYRNSHECPGLPEPGMTERTPLELQSVWSIYCPETGSLPERVVTRKYNRKGSDCRAVIVYYRLHTKHFRNVRWQRLFRVRLQLMRVKPDRFPHGEVLSRHRDVFSRCVAQLAPYTRNAAM